MDDIQNAGQGSHKVWYVVGIIVIIALWYFYGMKKAPVTEPTSSVVEQVQVTPPTAGNTTTDISTDLDQIVDTSAVLDQDAAASAQAVQGL